MNKMLIRHGRIVLPDRVLEDADLLTDGETIADVGHFSAPADAQVVDAGGNLVLAGFIDVHLHGGGGSDFMDGTPEDFSRVASVHCMHGTTSMLATTVACRYSEMKTLFELYQTAAASSSTADFLGVHLEGPYIADEMRGAQDPRWIRSPSRQEVDDLVRDAGDILVRCSGAPELPGMDYLAERLGALGVRLSIGHSNATCEQVLAAHRLGYSHITHMYSNTPSIRKINQVVHAGVVEAAYLLDDMTVELIGDGCHVPKELMQMVLKLKGEDNVLLISDAMRAAGTDVSESWLGSRADGHRVIIENGVAKLPDRSYFAGSIATGDRVFRNAVENVGLPLPVVTKMMSLNPARHVHAEKRKGSLEKGKDADIVIMDASNHPAHVFVRGRKIK